MKLLLPLIAILTGAFAAPIHTQASEYRVEFMGAATVMSPTDGPAAGDVYYLNGNLDDDWTEKEWDKYYSVAKWLVKHHFRVIMNPVAYPADISEAVHNERAVAIIWSSHGSADGTIWDAGGKEIPTNAFTGASKSLKLIVFSNCYSSKTFDKYDFRSGITIRYWTGTTTTEDLYAYLFADTFNHDLGW